MNGKPLFIPPNTREGRPFKGLGRPDINLLDFEVNLNEWEATSQGLGRPSIHLVDFEVNLMGSQQNVFLLFPLNLFGSFFKILHISIYGKTSLQTPFEECTNPTGHDQRVNFIGHKTNLLKNCNQSSHTHDPGFFLLAK